MATMYTCIHATISMHVHMLYKDILSDDTGPCQLMMIHTIYQCTVCIRIHTLSFPLLLFSPPLRTLAPFLWASQLKMDIWTQ